MKNSENEVDPASQEKGYDDAENDVITDFKAQEIFYDKAAKDLELVTVKLNYCAQIKANPLDETIIKCAMSSLRIKKYNSSNEECTLKTSDWMDTARILYLLYPRYKQNFQTFFTNISGKRNLF